MEKVKSSRGILFRGFHESESTENATQIVVGDKKQQGDWVYGDYIEVFCHGDKSPFNTFLIPKGKAIDREVGGDQMVEVNTATVGQFTGMTDISASPKQVFERDRIRFEYKGEPYTAEVRFEDGMFVAASRRLPAGYIPLFAIAENDGRSFWINAEVVGTIFDADALS